MIKLTTYYYRLDNQYFILTSVETEDIIYSAGKAECLATGQMVSRQRVRNAGTSILSSIMDLPSIYLGLYSFDLNKSCNPKNWSI